MPKILLLDIKNFRAFKQFTWRPNLGMNCLIGTGDSGKTSILDAIDYCMGARRSIQFSDYDFHKADTSKPINISVVLSELEDTFLSFDAYGDFFWGYNSATKKFEDEPGHGLETVLVLRLTVESDLEPQWALH
jgi:putative ATP-dependent endonuclease of OLD family